jgi:transposase-like protein
MNIVARIQCGPRANRFAIPHGLWRTGRADDQPRRHTRLTGRDSVVELAQQYGVSCKTIYKWLSRCESKRLSGLVDGPRRPKRSPLKTSVELALEIVQLRKERPRWGPEKLAAVMAQRHPRIRSHPS